MRLVFPLQASLQLVAPAKYGLSEVGVVHQQAPAGQRFGLRQPEQGVCAVLGDVSHCRRCGWSIVVTAAVSRCGCMGEARTPRLLAGRSHFSGSYIRDVAGAFDRTEALLLLREGIVVAEVTDGGLLDVQSVQPSLEAVVVANGLSEVGR